MHPVGATSARTLQGLTLFKEHDDEIKRIASNASPVPSQDGKRMYRVQYGDQECCLCPDHQYWHVPCLHIYV